MAKKLSGLSRRESLRRKKSGSITFTDNMQKELNALKKRPIDLSEEESREVTQWSKAVVGKFYRPIKKQITLRMDADVLDWFKHQPHRYQTLINTACREYMRKHG